MRYSWAPVDIQAELKTDTAGEQKGDMRIIILITGTLLLIFGLISMVTPIPGGTFLITVGAGMIICSSETAARYLQACRSKYNRFDSAITWLENKIGERLSGPLRRTRPNVDGNREC